MFFWHSKWNFSLRGAQQSTDQVMWASAYDLRKNYYFNDKFYLNKVLILMPNFERYSWSSASLTWTNVVHVNFVWNKEIAVERANPFTVKANMKHPFPLNQASMNSRVYPQPLQALASDAFKPKAEVWVFGHRTLSRNWGRSSNPAF